MIVRQLWDDPEKDGTETAHPAYWRGEARAIETICYLVNQIMDGKPIGPGQGREPWHSTRLRLEALVERARA